MHDSHSSNNSHNLQKACERAQNNSAEIETSQKSTIWYPPTETREYTPSD